MRRDFLNTAVVAHDGLALFEFGLVMELFGLPRPEFDSWYRLRVVGVTKGPIRAIGGLLVQAPLSLRVLDTAGTIIVPSWRFSDTPVPPQLVRKLQKAHREGARILSVCSGAFVLAAAGLLDGKRATTHWQYAADLARRFPAISVDKDVLYVDEGSIITSAGSAAGIDMALHLIRRDFGASVANTVARRLVVSPHRAGGQKQYIDTPLGSDPAEESFAELLDILRASLCDRHTVESMATAAHMSQRTFARRFNAVTGTTPHRWLQRERTRLAQQLLETTALPLDRIAQDAGFSDVQLLRLHFKRIVGTPPSHYRRSFQSQE